MQQTAQKITAFIFLLIAAAPMLFSLSCLLEEKRIRFESEEKLRHKNLQTLSLQTDDIRWVRSGKEAIIQGKYFDIRSHSTRDGITTLVGYFDADENELLEKYREFGEEEQEQQLFEIAAKFMVIPCQEWVYKELSPSGWQPVTRHYHRFTEILPEAPSMGWLQPPRL